MQLVQTVAPENEPITLDEAKAFMRILDSDDDALIESLIISAREQAETITNRQLMSATYELYSGELIYKLPKNPIQSIVKIEYLDENEEYQLFDSSLYYLFENVGIGEIAYKTLPSLITHQKACKVTFISGYEKVPEPIKQWIKIRVSTLYENREQFVLGVPINEFGSNFVDNLLSPYKVRPL